MNLRRRSFPLHSEERPAGRAVEGGTHQRIIHGKHSATTAWDSDSSHGESPGILRSARNERGKACPYLLRAPRPQCWKENQRKCKHVKDANFMMMRSAIQILRSPRIAAN